MTADEFNASYPVGTRVTAYPCTRDCAEHKPLRTRTRSKAWTVCGEPVVAVAGKTGGIALTHIDVVDGPV